MAMILEGFEQFDKTNDLAAQMRKAGYGVDGGSVVMGSGVNERGITTTRTSVSITAPWTSPKMSVGLAAMFTDRGALFSINGMVFTNDMITGFTRFSGATGSAIPIKKKWYFYEVEIDKEADTLELFINGKSQGKVKPELSMADAQKVMLKLNEYTKPPTLEEVSQMPMDSSARSFDNIYICDGDHLGPVTITTRFPDKSIQSDWTLHSSDEMSHADALGKIPSEELDRYVMTNKNGKVESMTSSKKLPDGVGKVVGIGLVALVRKTDREDAGIVFRVGDKSQTINDLPYVWGYRYAGWRAVDTDTKSSVEDSVMSLESDIRSV